MAKLSKAKRNKKPHTVYFTDATWALFSLSAAQRETTVSDWLRDAGHSAARSQRKKAAEFGSAPIRPLDVEIETEEIEAAVVEPQQGAEIELWPSGYPRGAECIDCGECHVDDPADIHGWTKVDGMMVAFASKNLCTP